MITRELLNKKELRDFIYDNSNRKLLIASRRLGKTSSLLLNMAINCAERSHPRDSVYITHAKQMIRVLHDMLIQICTELNIELIEIAHREDEYVYRIEGSVVKIVTSKEFMERGRIKTNYKDTYIDEPNSIINYRDLEEAVMWRTKWAKDAKLIIAGSSNPYNSTLKNLSADLKYSRHAILAKDYMPEQEYNDLKEQLNPLVFAAEINCEFLV